MGWSNVWRKGKSLSSGFVRGLILLLLILWCLALKAFMDGRNCNLLPSFSSCFFLPLTLGGHFPLYISPSHWSWLSICQSYRSLLECLSHSPPSLTCCELQQIRWYYSWVISSLMRPDCQLRAFNAEVTASFRIAPPPCPYSCPTVLVLLFRTIGRAVFEGVLLSPFSDLGWPRIGWSSVLPPSSLGLPYSSSDVSSFSAWVLGLIWNGLGFAKSFSPTHIYIYIYICKKNRNK